MASSESGSIESPLLGTSGQAVCKWVKPETRHLTVGAIFVGVGVLVAVGGISILLGDYSLAEPPELEGMAEPWDLDHIKRTCRGVAGAVGGRRLQAMMEEMNFVEEDDEDGDEPPGPGQTTTAIPTSVFHKPDRFFFRGAAVQYYGSMKFTEVSSIRARNLLIFIHGTNRNALDYFCSLVRIARASPLANHDTLLLTPRFIYEVEKLSKDDVWWNGTKPSGDWRQGGFSDPASGHTISSFAIIDYLLQLAGNADLFPLLERVWVLGHSAGGQTVQKYALASHMHPPVLSSMQAYCAETGLHPQLTVQYIVANPSAYTYLDENRWAYTCGHTGECTRARYLPYARERGRRGWSQTLGAVELQNETKLRPFICADSGFNDWGYGLNQTKTPIEKQSMFFRDHKNMSFSVEMYPFRDVAYIVGQNDTCWSPAFVGCDSSCWQRNNDCFRNRMDIRCPAMLQGPNRNQRARNYLEHLRRHYGKRVHNLAEIPGVGHQAELMYMTAIALLKSDALPEYLQFRGQFNPDNFVRKVLLSKTNKKRTCREEGFPDPKLPTSTDT